MKVFIVKGILYLYNSVSVLKEEAIPHNNGKTVIIATATSVIYNKDFFNAR